MPGVFYNGQFFSEEVNGFGAIAGLEYRKQPNHFFSIELRTKYGYYTFNDGTKWTTNNDGSLEPPKNPEKARLEYSLFSPQMGIVPKLHLCLDESFSLFLENEFAAALMTGYFEFKGIEGKKNFTESFFVYNVGIGADYKIKNCSLVGSINYSTLNFRGNIKKHRPAGYLEHIPNQNAILLINLIVKIPLSGK